MLRIAVPLEEDRSRHWHDQSINQSRQPIPPIITEAEMLPQGDRIYGIPVASRMPRGKIPELAPVPASVHLAVADGEVAECVEGCGVGVTLDGLGGGGVVSWWERGER